LATYEWDEPVIEKIVQNDAYFRSLIQNSMDIITILNQEGVIMYESPSVEKITGYLPEELVGKNVFSYVHPDDIPKIVQAFEKVINSAGIPQAAELRFATKDGRWCFLEVNGTNLLHDPFVKGIVINSRDVSERKHFEVALARSEAKFRSLIQNCSDIMVILDPSGLVIYNNRSFDQVYGSTEEELIGHRFEDFIHPDDVAGFQSALMQLHDCPQSNLSVELRFQNKSGTWLFLELLGVNLLQDPSVVGILINARDITERKLSEEKLRYLAWHDPLTQLPNRTLFTQCLEQTIKRSQRYPGLAFAVLFIDLDRFKVVNDSLGHVAGDTLLVEVANRLTHCLREVDIVARLGGDEFAVLLENTEDINQVIQVAHRISQVFAQPFFLNGREVFSSASIGIALSAVRYHSPDDLLRDADVALYRAKDAGRARFELFDIEMHNHAVRRLHLETDLRQGLQRGEFLLFFQPIISLQTGQLKGMEALIRWQHPQQGLVSPMTFIPLAEETGLINAMGWWIFKEACSQARSWDELLPTQDPLTISVNVSARQFTQPDLLERIRQILEDSQLSPQRLCLEITESVLIDKPETATNIFQELRAMGVQLYMDDFGTGYSSLNYLHRFPMDALKIDQSFIRRLTDPDSDYTIVRTILTLANHLGMQVIAEGVEQENQRRHLQSLACDYAQGYWFSPPLNAAQTLDYISQHHGP
jgi:diguanylate cyclase (GGDEF)-like protein/PAS domain S-box-containing protein